MYLIELLFLIAALVGIVKLINLVPELFVLVVSGGRPIVLNSIDIVELSELVLGNNTRAISAVYVLLCAL